MTRLLHGLVLSGGQSSRMGPGVDKGALVYRDGLDQRARCHGLLSEFCDRVFLSCRRGQIIPPPPPGAERLDDLREELGPAGGLITAFRRDPTAGWLVLACDLPNLTRESLGSLVGHRREDRAATVSCRSPSWDAEPLCAIWEPQALLALSLRVRRGYLSPKRLLDELDPVHVALEASLLENVNSLQDFRAKVRDLPAENS